MIAARTPTAGSLTPVEGRILRLYSLDCSLRDVCAILGRSIRTIDHDKTRGSANSESPKAAELTRVAIKLAISHLDDARTEQERTKLEQSIDAPLQLADRLILGQ